MFVATKKQITQKESAAVFVANQVVLMRPQVSRCVATQKGTLSQTVVFSNPHYVVFVPKPNQTMGMLRKVVLTDIIQR